MYEHGHVTSGAIFHDDVDIVVIPLEVEMRRACRRLWNNGTYLKIVHLNNILMFDMLENFDFVDQEILRRFRQILSADAFNGIELGRRTCETHACR